MISGSHASKKNHEGNRKRKVISINFNIHIFTRCKIHNPFGICWMHLRKTAVMCFGHPLFFLFGVDNVFLSSLTAYHHAITTYSVALIHWGLDKSNRFLIFYSSINFFYSCVTFYAPFTTSEKIIIIYLCKVGTCIALDKHNNRYLLSCTPSFAFANLSHPIRALLSNEIVIIHRFNV